MLKKPRMKCITSWMLFFLFSINFSEMFAQQNPTLADTSWGLGTLNETAYAAVLQPDGKIVVGGGFTYFKSNPANRLIRLNSNGSRDNTFQIGTGPNNYVYSLDLQTDGKILIGGWFTSYNGTTTGSLARLNSDGSLDNNFNIGGAGANSTVSVIKVLPDGKILIGGQFYNYNGAAIRYLARLNSDGTADNTFNNGGTGLNVGASVVAIQLQSDGKIIIAGNFTSYNGNTANRIARLNADGTFDNTFNTGTGANFTISSCLLLSDGKVLIGGGFNNFNGTAKNYIARLNSNGSIDNTFITGTGFDYAGVYSIVEQSDGKILIGGGFTNYNGTSSTRIIRLNASGSVDNTFSTGTGLWGNPEEICLQPDGKMIVVGSFNSYNNFTRNKIARINADGSIDHTYAPALGGNYQTLSISLQPDGKTILGGTHLSFNDVVCGNITRHNADGTNDVTFTPGTGADHHVISTAVQTDGKIVISGTFYEYNGTVRNRIARLNVNGTLDNTFNIGTGLDNVAEEILIQPDGKILLAGGFTTYDGTTVNGLVRLNSNGSIDNSFSTGTGADSYIESLAIQEDGKILIGGLFTSFNGTAVNRIARLNSDGSIDNSFTVGTGANNSVVVIAIQENGKIIIGGEFTAYNGITKNRIARLNSNGSLDHGFRSGVGVNNRLMAIAIQRDGKIIIGGLFATYNGISSNAVARLYSDGTFDNSFEVGSDLLGSVSSIAIHPSGKIVLAGAISRYKGAAYNNILYLNGTPSYYNRIRGYTYQDNNQDCDDQTTEKYHRGIMVKALPGPFYGRTDDNGQYQILADSGTVSYSVSQEFNSTLSKLLVTQCATSHTVQLTGISKDTCCFNFADSVKQCSAMNISIQNTRMRRCMRNNTYINYCNLGTTSAANVQIKVQYPDYMRAISSTPMWSSRNDSTLFYNLGTIGQDVCGTIVLIDSVICGNSQIRGLTQCIKATISPSQNCINENPVWDKSSIKVEGKCSDSIRFIIKNAGSGNMTGNHPFRVFINDSLIYTGSFILNSGEFITVSYPAERNTVRLEADQHPLHPGRSRPRATIEGCGNINQYPDIKKLVSSAPLDDLDEEVAITCNEIVDSFDPNDKQATPSGTGTNHQIAPGEELEYTVRFQNTGTDTAYVVRIVDTLDVALDPGTFMEGTGSHPYTLEVSGKGKAILQYTFANINLPDSTTNIAGSNGLVSFRVTIPAATPIGTSIRNKAYIFFDYNEPVITNQTLHTAGINVPQNLSKGDKVKVSGVGAGTGTTNIQKRSILADLKIYPNPTAGQVTIESSGLDYPSELRILSLTGVVQKHMVLQPLKSQEINLRGLTSGTYLYEIWQNGERQNGGLIQIK